MADPGPSIPPTIGAAPPAPAEAPPQPTIPVPAPTILTHLHALLDARQSQNLSLPYLHPYAPVSAKRLKPGKGKGPGKNSEGEGTGGEVEVIRELRAAVGVWREVLFKEREDGGRLSQSLKEVVSHQTALLPSSSSLLPFPPSSSPPSAPPLFPSSHLNSPPINLLQSLSSSVGLQTFLEDSQFGLLQASLAIAGERIVVDVDLEVDTLAGEDDADGGEGTPLGTPGLGTGTPRKASAAFSAAVGTAGTPASAQMQAQGSSATDERGKIKLSKLATSHVTPTGGTGQSEWIRRVLSERVEAYLELWNAAQAQGAGVWQREAEVKRLERELGDVKIMDDIACGPEGGEGTSGSGDGKGKEGEVDWFDELEKIAKMVQERIAGNGSSTKLYPADINSVFPTFKLLPDTPSSAAPDPTFRIRPAQKSLGEHVPCPFSASSSLVGIPTDNDVAMEESWIKGDWVVEYVTGADGSDGLVVTRGWLSPPDSQGEGKDEIPVNGGIRVENLLYRSYQQSSFFSFPPQPQVFPYTASFVSVDSESGAEQHWSMAQPGPLGWVVGRVGLSKSADGFTKTIEALRRQAAMNQMFASVFRPELLRDYDVPAAEGDDDEDMEEEDLLDGPQKTVPCSFALLEHSLRVSVPLVQPDGSSSPIELVYGGSSDTTEGSSGVRRLEEVDKDLVKVVAGLLASAGGG
ncbi:hypothetical protein IAT38_002253 [Cryptococcus sp. DSM 104549]